MSPSSLSSAARAAIEAGPLAHLVTINRDGSPQVALVWVGIEGDEIVSGHLNPNQQKLRNIARDSRVVLSAQTGGRTELGLDHYLVIRGRARVTNGGAVELLRHLAPRYLGEGTTFPSFRPGQQPPAGVVIHVSVEIVGGVGPWS